MEQKIEFVQLAMQPETNFSVLCRRFGISRDAGYKWLSRYLEEGEAGLVERSRRPLHSPLRMDSHMESLILDASHRWPAWGARKLKAWLELQGHMMPAASTIQTVLHRLGRRTPTKPMQRAIRFEHESPNQLWQMDFKGHFETGSGRCHPLTILDDHSRYLLCLSACSNERRETVQDRLVDVFARYGLPDRMLMDNGAPWGDTPTSWTALELWLMRQGIRVGHSRPYHPQTQGKLERLHSTLISEVLQGRYFTDMEQVSRAFKLWREDYNQQRPHEALGQKPPITRYHPSSRDYKPNPVPPQYDASMGIRKVDSSGKISFKNNAFRIGKAFIRETVGIREEMNKEIYSLWWYSTKIGLIDLKQRTVRVGKLL